MYLLRDPFSQVNFSEAHLKQYHLGAEACMGGVARKCRDHFRTQTGHPKIIQSCASLRMDNDATSRKLEAASGGPLAMQLRRNRIVDDVAHIPNGGGNWTPSAM
jgi:hypothetical protein